MIYGQLVLMELQLKNRALSKNLLLKTLNTLLPLIQKKQKLICTFNYAKLMVKNINFKLDKNLNIN